MLEIRHRDGHITAFSYNVFDRAKFDPSDGIILKFAGAQVRIIGRNLNAEARPHLRLFEGITRHRVSWIQEADEPTAMEVLQGDGHRKGRGKIKSVDGNDEQGTESSAITRSSAPHS